jgi:DNA-binding winged helix-turn-helix (wHTH) protein
VAFGLFEYDEASGELRKGGARIRLQDQPRTILALLLKRPGEVVEREQIRAALWPEVHVNYDRSLNAAVGRLRQALCDVGTKPLYIERVPRRGYQFIAPVTERPAVPRVPQIAAPQASAAPVKAPPPTLPSEGLPKSKAWLGMAAVAASCAAVLLVLSFKIFGSTVPSAVRVTMITNDGRSKSPWLATDGARLYLTEFMEGAIHLFQVPVAGGAPELLHGPRSGNGPQALDARRESGEVLVQADNGLYVWSAVQNRIRRISERGCAYGQWSPDYSQIACTTENALEVMNSDGTHRRVVRSLVRGRGVAWRPDGRAIRYSGFAPGETSRRMYEYDLDVSSEKVLRETAADEPIAGVFLRRGWHAYASSADHNLYAVERGVRVPLTHGPVQFYQVTANPAGDTLYAMGEVRRGELMRFDAKGGGWQVFLGGRSADVLAWSPRGDYVAYVTYPEGELWRSRPDGSDALQLTSRPVRAYHPNWSPDGKEIAYAAGRPGGIWRIFVTGANGGSPRELTPGVDPGLHQFDPSWSPDGGAIAFAPLPGIASGDVAIYLADVATGNIRRLPATEGLFSPRWSRDGKTLAALSSTRRVTTYDLETQQTRFLTEGNSGWPHWSKDGAYLYFFAGSRQTYARVPRKGGAVESVTTLPFLVAGNTLGGEWDHNFYAGFDPHDRPLALRDFGTSELYAVMLDWK